jgi:RimJ/RimL family protein N-acetyltransferase
VALLREVTETDLDVLFAHWTDPEANRMAAFAPADPSDREAFDERWRRIRESDDSTALVIEVDGKVVGSISSWTNEGEREVTYWIGREHWGKGIATRALAEFLADVERARPGEHGR